MRCCIDIMCPLGKITFEQVVIVVVLTDMHKGHRTWLQVYISNTVAQGMICSQKNVEYLLFSGN